LLKELSHRSTTDLSIDLCSDDLKHHQAMEIHKEQIYVRELHAKQMESGIILILILSNQKIIAY
jgi:hypothetical protein